MTWHKYNILFFSQLHINSVYEWPRKPFFSVQLFHRLDFNSYSRKIFFAINQIKIIEIQNYLLTTLKILSRGLQSRHFCKNFRNGFIILLCREIIKWTYFRILDTAKVLLKENSNSNSTVKSIQSFLAKQNQMTCNSITEENVV